MKQIKTIMSLFCAAALFAACSSTDDLEPVVQTGQQTESDAVGFDVYTRGSQSATRAGYVGEIDATAFQVTGFGVYAYVTSGNKWVSAGTSAKPEFMANQLVSYNSTKTMWEYTPVKYWPNQANTGSGTGYYVDELGGGTAETTEDIDYVSFFAYAPYVDIATVPYSGTTIPEEATTDAKKVKPDYTGITWLSSNTSTGDPKVFYRMATDPTNSVDLMYGVAARNYSKNETTGKQGEVVTAGKPFLDMTKEVVDDKLNYRFQHALTKLAVNVDAYFDEVRNGSIPGTNNVDPNTRIVIESILLTTDKLAVYGTLNMNNTSVDANKPNWGLLSAAAIINTDAGNYNSGAGYELPIANNLKHVVKTTDDKYFGQQPLGVTNNKQSLLGYAVDGTTPASLMFVPNTSGTGDLIITITYNVITRDSRLEKGYSLVTNVIKNKIAASSLKFDPGYSTVLNLHLGMTTVKMDAVVSAWDGTDVQEIDLPANVEVSALTATTSIDAYGAITKNNISATLSGQTSATPLGIEDVYFTTDAAGNDVLPVTQPGGGSTYYIPGNYKGSPRDIYLWYGGKSVKLSAQQPAIAGSADAVAIAADITACAGTGSDADKIVAAGGSVILTVTVNETNIKDFNINDWTVKQQIDSGDQTNATVSASTTTPSITFTVTAPANSSAARTLNFILKHKDGMEVKVSKSQLAGS